MDRQNRKQETDSDMAAAKGGRRYRGKPKTTAVETTTKSAKNAKGTTNRRDRKNKESQPENIPLNQKSSIGDDDGSPDVQPSLLPSWNHSNNKQKKKEETKEMESQDNGALYRRELKKKGSEEIETQKNHRQQRNRQDVRNTMKDLEASDASNNSEEYDLSDNDETPGAFSVEGITRFPTTRQESIATTDDGDNKKTGFGASAEILEAVAVDDDHLRQEIRDEVLGELFIGETAQAVRVDEEEQESSTSSKTKMILVFSASVCLIVVGVIAGVFASGIIGPGGENPTQPPQSFPPQPPLFGSESPSSSSFPSFRPTSQPTFMPSLKPSNVPSVLPTSSQVPSASPTSSPAPTSVCDGVALEVNFQCDANIWNDQEDICDGLIRFQPNCTATQSKFQFAYDGGSCDESFGFGTCEDFGPVPPRGASGENVYLVVTGIDGDENTNILFSSFVEVYEIFLFANDGRSNVLNFTLYDGATQENKLQSISFLSICQGETYFFRDQFQSFKLWGSFTSSGAVFLDPVLQANIALEIRARRRVRLTALNLLSNLAICRGSRLCNLSDRVAGNLVGDTVVSLVDIPFEINLAERTNYTFLATASGEVSGSGCFTTSFFEFTAGTDFSLTNDPYFFTPLQPTESPTSF